MMSAANPIYEQERNKLIDVLRGFALLGVLMANLEGFVIYALAEEEAKKLVTTPLDHSSQFFLQVFIDNKFITLFSLLFGFGFGVIIQRVQQKGMPVNSFFLRRMTILLMIGLVHLGLWWGEILSTYALSAMLLLFFRKASNKTLLVWGAVLLFVVCPLIQGLRWYVLPEMKPYTEQLFKQYFNAMANGNLLDIAEYNYKIANFLFIQRWGQLRDTAEILAKFLFGFYILRSGIMAESNFLAGRFKKIILRVLPIALLYLAEKIFIYFTAEPTSKAVLMIIYVFEKAGILSLSIIYASAITLLYRKGKFSKLFDACRYVGMMSLTNYLTHTLFFIFIYYGIGLGLIGKMHIQWAIPIALVIYTGQIFLSKAWLSKMRYGPVEWIWRQACYGKRLVLKKSSVP